MCQASMVMLLFTVFDVLYVISDKILNLFIISYQNTWIKPLKLIWITVAIYELFEEIRLSVEGQKCLGFHKKSLCSLSSCHETSRRILRYGNSFPSTFPEVLLAHASPMTGQLSQSMQIWRARDSINAMPATITSESSTSPVEFVMATVCKICAGPIKPLDHHLHCVACLGLAHAEAALDESDCGHCADLPVSSAQF